MFAMFTYVHCFPVIQHSECEPLGLYIGLSFSIYYSTSTCPYVHSRVSYFRYTSSQYIRLSMFPVITSWPPSSRWALMLAPNTSWDRKHLTQITRSKYHWLLPKRSLTKSSLCHQFVLKLRSLQMADALCQSLNRLKGVICSTEVGLEC